MRRAWVAGRGAVTALGVGAPALLAGAFEGRSGLAPLRRLAGTDCLTAIAGEVPVDVVRSASGELPLHMATLAAREALGRTRAETRPGDLALVLSSTKADMGGVVGPGDGLGQPRVLAHRLAKSLGIHGPLAAVSCACSSGLTAIALAGRWIAAGHAERVLVVGVDALNAFVLRGFSALLALDPGPCRPFDAARRGLSLGEGAAALLLSAQQDDAEDGAWLAGWGESNDANHVTGPSRDGAGLALAAERALARAGMSADEIDVLHLHGTGTPYNDASEALAMKTVFGGVTPPAVGSKAITGHTLGAAGVLEVLVALEAVSRGAAPPNVGLEVSGVDPALTLSTEGTPLREREGPRAALKTCAGFGGINTALVLRR